MKKRILSCGFSLFILVILAINAALPVFAVTAAEYEDVVQWNLSIFSTRSTDERALEAFIQQGYDIPSDDPDIISLAETITKDKGSDYEKVRAIHNWVASNIWYDMELVNAIENGGKSELYDIAKENSVRDAILSMLEHKRGSCSWYALLTVSLLRAAGIPANAIVGYTNSGSNVSLNEYLDFMESTGKQSIHEWCEAYVNGKWIIIDPTWDTLNIYDNGRYSPQRNCVEDYFDISLRKVSQDHILTMRYDAFVTEATVYDKATSISANAFRDCSALTEVILPEGLTSIEHDAFYACKNLKTIRIPESVTSIGKSAFSGCASMEDIILPKNMTSIGNSAFSFCSSMKSIVLPERITRIEDLTFEYCVELKRVFLPDGVTDVGGSAFSNCRSLKSIRIPESVASIGPNAFGDCYKLASIYLPDSIDNIGSNTFRKCSDLVCVSIPGSVTSIGANAFQDCSSLVIAVIPPGVSDIKDSAFSRCRNVTVYGETGSAAEKFASSSDIPFIPGTPLETASAWSREGISDAIKADIVPGDLQNNYTNVVTRAEFCRMAIKWLEFRTGKDIDMILAEKGLSRDVGAFSDTSDPDILAAYALGITSGTVAPSDTSPGTFTPNGSFSREQAATMVRNVCKAAGINVSDVTPAGYEDIGSASSWAVDGINFCYANGIMTGTSTEPFQFSPKNPYTRQESIVTFNRI